MRYLPLALLLVLPVSAHAEETQTCTLMRGKVEDLKIRLDAAKARREEWVKDHCKLIHNSTKRPVPGRHWVCDGKFAGNEGTVIQSPEERDLEGLLYNAAARADLCCGKSPPNWCKN